jgi:hypothetical protein
MKRAPSRMRTVAERLIAHETKGGKPSAASTPVAFQVCERLRPDLATLMGNTGFRTLLLRALVLVKPEVAWLGAVQVKPDGSLERLAGLEERFDPDGMAEGSAVLLSKLLELLAAFVGEELTLSLVREEWPKMSLNDLDTGKRS